LGRGVKAERRDGVTGFRARREERAQTVEHERPAGAESGLASTTNIRLRILY
jgi:hypothetical protein